MKLHINAIVKGVELIFKITEEVSVSDLNNYSQDERAKHFAKVFKDAKLRCRGYKHEDIKQYELKWSSEYLTYFKMGTPYHFLLSNYIDFLKGDILEITDNRIYFIKDGKRQMSGFDWITEIDKARGKKELSKVILPTHNFEMLKAHRLKNVFEADKAKLIEENRINKIETDDADIKLLYIQFLRDELKYADEWTARISKLTTKNLYKADLIQIEKYKVFINKEISKQEASIKLLPPKKKPISFVWQGKAETELPKLHQRLIKAEMIDEQTDLKDFIATFTGQPTDNIKPIVWIAKTNLLAYFLWSKFKSLEWANIAGAGKLFLKDGKPVSGNNLSVSKSQCRNFDKPPKDYKEIDKILSDIQKQ